MANNTSETKDEETLVIYHDGEIAGEIEGCKSNLLMKVIS
ncbi:uncharacterized protein G2W53_016351 [Senna tora]|uniref:Uncharacterized protein n=1 Tax=Senna tora TaxID=362788 RepID=A0A834WJG9_9FABA|nr:uncharacterized protein G2W53_016351 [Senna tora]